MESAIVSHYEKSAMDFELDILVDSIKCRVRVLKNRFESDFTLVLTSFKYNHNAGQWLYHARDLELKELNDIETMLKSYKYKQESCSFEFENHWFGEYEYYDDHVLEPCCVCFEPTYIKTDCNHPLCVPCYDKIPMVKTEYGKWTRCPMCREPCAFDYQKYEDF